MMVGFLRIPQLMMREGRNEGEERKKKNSIDDLMANSPHGGVGLSN